MRSVIGCLIEWLYGLWRAAWQRNAAEFYGELGVDPDAGTVTREGRRHANR